MTSVVNELLVFNWGCGCYCLSMAFYVEEFVKLGTEGSWQGRWESDLRQTNHNSAQRPGPYQNLLSSLQIGDLHPTNCCRAFADNLQLSGASHCRQQTAWDGPVNRAECRHPIGPFFHMPRGVACSLSSPCVTTANYAWTRYSRTFVAWVKK